MTPPDHGAARLPSGQTGGDAVFATLLLPVYLPTLLLSFGQSVVVPTLPLYAMSFHVDYTLVSLAVAGASLGTMVSDIPSGMLLTRLGRRGMMIVGCLLIAIAALGIAIARTFPEVVAWRLVGGAGVALWSISRIAYLADVVPVAQRGRAIAGFGGINRVGAFTGPAIGGFLGQRFGLASPFVLTGATALAAGMVSFWLVRDAVRPRPLPGHGAMSLGTVASVIRHHAREFSTAGSAQIFAQMIRAGRQIVIPLYGARILGLDVAQVGAVVSISAGVDMLLFLPAGFVMDHLGRKFASVPSFVIMAIGMGMVPFSHSFFTLAAATLVIGVGNGIGSGTMMTLGADLAPHEGRGEFLGVWRLMGDLGSSGGPLAVGKIADVVGLGPAAGTLCGIGLLAAAVLAAFVRETLQRDRVIRPG